MNTKVFTSAVTDVESAHMVELANNILKTPNFWLLIVGAFFIWAMTRYIPNCNHRKGSQVHTTTTAANTITTAANTITTAANTIATAANTITTAASTITTIHRYRHRKIKKLSSKTNSEGYYNKSKEGSSQDKITQSISNNNSSLKNNKSPSQSKSAYANSTPDFVPLSASIQSAPPSPPHFKTPSRIVPTNYGSEIKLKLMTNEDKALRISNLREQHMKYRPTISSRLNPIRRCELGLRSSVGVLSSRYLSDVKMDTGYSEDQRKNIIWAAGNRNEHSHS